MFNLADIRGALQELIAGVVKGYKVVRVSSAVAAADNYTAEDVLSNSATVGTAWELPVGRGRGGSGYIVKAQAFCSVTALTPRLALYLFRAVPTSNLNDNAANTAVLLADLPNYVGRIDFPAMEDLGGVSEALVTPSTYGNLPLAFECASESSNLYGILVTRDAITGESVGMTISITLTVEQN